jgi:hypothetical protein
VVSEDDCISEIYGKIITEAASAFDAIAGSDFCSILSFLGSSDGLGCSLRSWDQRRPE